MRRWLRRARRGLWRRRSRQAWSEGCGGAELLSRGPYGLLLQSDLAAPFPFSSSGWIARRGGTARRRHALHSAWATRFPRPCGLAEAKKRASLHGDESLWWDTTRTDTRAFFRRGAVKERATSPHRERLNKQNYSYRKRP
uniref:Uncharacterized protein n=1 Tax=Oryza barthii TaxID=65489 RepID=A0A0D3GYA2_9ORYZ